MRSRLGRVVAAAIGIALLAGAYLLFLAPPGVPATAAKDPIARTAMTGPIAPDMVSEDGAEVPPVSPVGQVCLERIVREAGSADVCWAASREPRDSHPQQDYYYLRIYGSYRGTSALGIRWLVVKSRLVTPPLLDVFDGWPSGTYDGPCEEQPVSLMVPLASIDRATLCGHTTAGPGSDGSWTSTWTCSPCRPFDSTTRELGLYGVVGVAEGMVPAWDVFVDFGS
jgi:hypothetical protein